MSKAISKSTEIAFGSVRYALAYCSLSLKGGQSMQSTLEVLRNLTEPIISAEDWGNLSLNSAPDTLSRVCRAWLLAGCRDHPDYHSSTALIARSASEPTGKFLKHAVAGEKINLKNGMNKILFNENLPAGMYVVTFELESGEFISNKILIKN